MTAHFPVVFARCAAPSIAASHVRVPHAPAAFARPTDDRNSIPLLPPSYAARLHTMHTSHPLGGPERLFEKARKLKWNIFPRPLNRISYIIHILEKNYTPSILPLPQVPNDEAKKRWEDTLDEYRRRQNFSNRASWRVIKKVFCNFRRCALVTWGGTRVHV